MSIGDAFSRFDTAWSQTEYDVDLYRGDIEGDIEESVDDKTRELIISLRALAESATSLADMLEAGGAR